MLKMRGEERKRNERFVELDVFFKTSHQKKQNTKKRRKKTLLIHFW